MLEIAGLHLQVMSRASDERIQFSRRMCSCFIFCLQPQTEVWSKLRLMLVGTSKCVSHWRWEERFWVALFFLSSIWFRELCEPHEPYCPAGGTLIRTFVLEPYIIQTNLKKTTLSSQMDAKVCLLGLFVCVCVYKWSTGQQLMERFSHKRHMALMYTWHYEQGWFRLRFLIYQNVISPESKLTCLCPNYCKCEGIKSSQVIFSICILF